MSLLAAALLLVSAAFAQEPAAAPLTLADQWAATAPATLLEDAVERRSLGDFEGADGRLRWLLAQQPGPAPAYHLALSLEFQERYDEAEAAYRDVSADWPTSPEAGDARFRQALCLEELGRPADALVLIKALQREGDWSERDRLTLELERGVTTLRDGRARKGLKQLRLALAEAEGVEGLTWMQAKAHTAVARHLLSAAAEVEMRNDRKAKKALQDRAAGLTGAEAQVVAVARLGEPEYALEGLLLMGDAYLALQDDLLAAAPPRKLSPEQVAIYQDALRAQVAVLGRKAYRYYDEGVTLAARTRWQGRLAGELRARRDALEPDSGTR